MTSNLCLIQIADENEAAAIDPKAPGIDLTPLLDLLVHNEEVLKIFHAGGQDLEIVYNLTGKTPYPLFDTQIAAMALGGACCVSTRSYDRTRVWLPPLSACPADRFAAAELSVFKYYDQQRSALCQNKL